MPDAIGSTASGALSGAGTGAAIGSVVPVIGTGIGAAAGAIIGGVGGYLSASGTSDAQTAQNKAAAQAAAAQSAQSFFNYLSSRGVNLQQLVAADPRGSDFWTKEYAAARAKGDKRDFNTWLVAAIQAAPADPIWNSIANPAGTAGAANTTLPAWAVDANGKPLQPSTLAQLVAISNGSNDPSRAPIASIATLANVKAFFAANPLVAKAISDNMAGSDDTRSPEQWLVDHITGTEAQSGGGTFTDLLRNFAVNKAGGGNGLVTSPGTGADAFTALPPPAPAGGSTAAPAGPAGTGNNLTIDPAISHLIPAATSTLGSVFDGTMLQQVLNGLKPVADARDANAAAQLARINELRGLSGGVLDTELGGIAGVLGARTAGAGGIYDATVSGAGTMRAAAEKAAQDVHDANVAQLAKLLGVRLDAAQQIYDATSSGAGGVRDARTAGANQIYGAESLQADTYGQSAEQALSRMLAQQSAERLRQGFTGGSSGSDITRARLMAGAIQQGAGARAQAGVNLQKLLSDAGTGYATDIGQAGISRASTVGQSKEADAVAQLNAAVDLAKGLGLAGTNYAGTTAGAGVTRATSLASAGEQNSIAQLQAKVADATRRLSYLTSDADIAKANADLANAQDALNAIIANQSRAVGAIAAPFQLGAADLSLKTALTDQQYTDLDALLKRLGSFTTGGASGPSLTTSTSGSVLNGTQIAGGALTGAGSAIGNLSNNMSLADLIKLIGGTGAGTPASTPAANPVTGSLLGSSNFLGNASVFAPAPKP